MEALVSNVEKQMEDIAKSVPPDAQVFSYLFKTRELVEMYEQFTESVSSGNEDESCELASEIIASAKEMKERHIV